jgi:catechol 2,3-dioxygenase-like lactoylglutathione lyase family enzyme
MPSKFNDRFDHLFICPRDYDASFAFYVDKLGWNVNETWQGEDGTRGCELSSGGVQLVLAEARGGELSPGSHGPASGRMMLHLDIHNLEKRFSAVPTGDHVVRQPETNRLGPDWFVLQDPDGNLIAFNDRRQKN